MKKSELRQLIREEIRKVVNESRVNESSNTDVEGFLNESELNEKHWKDSDINPAIKVGDWFGSFNKMKVVYISKETGAFVVEKPSPHNEFYIFPKEGASKFNGARDMTTNLDSAKEKADKLR